MGAGLPGTLTIPKNVTTISNSAFAGCSGVTAVYVLNPNAVIAADALPPNAVVYGVADSTAQSYAEKMEMQFVAIDTPSKETAADITDNGNYKFTVDENGVITGYERADSSKAYSLKVTIPSTVDGKAVTGVASNIFEAGSEASSVYAVTISEGITSISDYAFANSLKLTHVSFPKTLAVIGRGAFENCALAGDLVFTENVKDIGMMAFKGNNALTSATILNKDCLLKASAFPRGLKAFTLYGYYDSTARSFAERNKLTFVSLDGEPEVPTDPSGGEKDPSANVGDVIDPPADEEPGDNIVTIIQESDLTTVIIVVIVMMLMMLLLGGGLILLIIIKGKKQFEENQ